MRTLLIFLFGILFYFQLNAQRTEDSLFVQEDNVQIPLKNGNTVCAMFVYAKTKPQPCIIWYDIYADSSKNLLLDITNAAKRYQYNLAIINTRGKKCSSSELKPFENDAEDAYEIIDWLSKQPWCDGRVGMTGGSYLGFSQWASTKKIHPALKAIVPQVSVGAGIDFPMHNGVFMSYAYRWLRFVDVHMLTNFEEFLNSSKWDSVFFDYYKKGLKFASIDSLYGKPNANFQRWLQHPTYDNYWKSMTPQGAEFAKINIPVLTITGYWDDDQTGAMYYYNEHLKHNPRAQHQLLIGPYDHASAQGTKRDSLGGWPIDSVAKIKINGIIFKWFDSIFKGKTLPELLGDKVNFEVIGKNEWRHVGSLNQMFNTEQRYYLLPNKLSKAKPEKTGFHQQKVDFKDRSIYRPAGEEIGAFPKLLTDSLSPLPEQIIYETEEFKEPIILSGYYDVNLNISISKKDVDLVFTLYEKLPNGKYLALSEVVQRASMSKDISKRNLLKPNTIESFSIRHNYMTCKQLSKGSKLVLMIGVNKNPHWQVNYGTGKDVSIEDISDAKNPLLIRWYHDSTITFRFLK